MLKNFRDGIQEAIDPDQIANVPPLEGRGVTKSTKLKILTPNQMFTRLPILLAEAQAGNNSQKLKNEIRQLLYLLYRSKKINKTIYKNLIKTI